MPIRSPSCLDAAPTKLLFAVASRRRVQPHHDHRRASSLLLGETCRNMTPGSFALAEGNVLDVGGQGLELPSIMERIRHGYLAGLVPNVDQRHKMLRVSSRAVR